MSELFERIRNDHSDFFPKNNSDKNVSLAELHTPFELFQDWLQQAVNQSYYQANACMLATVNSELQASMRIVFLKELINEQFIFYTNYHSRKGRDIAYNPKVALSFFWSEAHRQIHIQGICEKIDASISDEYFASRPRESQLGAWASEQSELLQSRDTLTARYEKFNQQFPNSIPRPEHWGGYALNAQSIEFWQGQPSRLHDRMVFKKNKNGNWDIRLLNP